MMFALLTFIPRTAAAIAFDVMAWISKPATRQLRAAQKAPK